MKNAIDWFDVPAADFERAKKFYATIFDKEVKDLPIQTPWKMAGLPNYDSAQRGVGGGILWGTGYKLSNTGVVVYLNAGVDFDNVLARIPKAGGKILVDKRPVGEKAEYGYLAYFLDSEGNRLGLRST